MDHSIRGFNRKKLVVKQESIAADGMDLMGQCGGVECLCETNAEQYYYCACV